MSIYDFIKTFGIATGINTGAHYVGYTDSPEKRPFNRDHRGFGDMLHWTSRNDEAYDYFAFYNLFKVTTVADNPATMFSFAIANSMVDEITVGDETRILEKVLIKYFGTKPQEWNKQNEAAELNNKLEEIAAERNINSITLDIQMVRPCELFRFFSRSAAPRDRHHLTCQLSGDSGAVIVPPKDLGISDAPL